MIRRTKLGESVTWDGRISTFRTYMHQIESHLFQTGTDYLINPRFFKQFSEHGDKYLHSMEFWNDLEISFPQVASDRCFLYGMLIGSCRGIENSIMIYHQRDQDRIMA